MISYTITLFIRNNQFESKYLKTCLVCENSSFETFMSCKKSTKSTYLDNVDFLKKVDISVDVIKICRLKIDFKKQSRRPSLI